MSDVEEPAAKLSKMETASQNTEDELDEGQEEWLSEDILTDEDGNNLPDQRDDQANNSVDSAVYNGENEEGPNNDEINDNNASNDEITDIKTQNETDDIEQALGDMENSNQNDLPGVLGSFLTRKPKEIKYESDIDESAKQSEDDGHSTDELLRMLGEDDQKTKKELTKKPTKSTGDDDETTDDEVYKVKTNIKKIIVNKPVPKAEPEQISDEDCDMDEPTYEPTRVKRTFNVGQRRHYASKSTTQPSVIRPTITVTKKAMVFDKTKELKTISREVKSVRPDRPVAVKNEVKRIVSEMGNINRVKPTSEELFDRLVMEDVKKVLVSPEKRRHQDIMKPEEMDEEVPSDGESNNSEDDSLFDDFASSDSEDVEDWFTLDIREERAGDYIPLLGSSAHALLAEEKDKVASRLLTLKESLSALNSNARQQAEQLRKATATLAELDANLKTS
ncbi:unnamed protein product [Leptosia nina]|uniref:Uncharacterized protein n=1 Tax=Leptosia nina TaxID=320188 RepID=A0AAV1K5S1_9NEOP